MDFRSLQSLALRVGEALTLDDVFNRIVAGLAAQADVALARVWLVLPGDFAGSREWERRPRTRHVAFIWWLVPELP